MADFVGRSVAAIRARSTRKSRFYLLHFLPKAAPGLTVAVFMLNIGTHGRRTHHRRDRMATGDVRGAGYPTA